MPHKNSVDKICRLLDSIPDYVNVVVVDDSSDREELEKLAHVVLNDYQNVRLLENTYSEKNAGTARNLAIDSCSHDTDWVIFADADDEFVKENFELFINYLRESSSVDVLYFNCIAKKEGSGEVGSRCDRYRTLINSWPLSKKTIAFLWPVPWGKAIKYKDFLIRRGLRFGSRVASNDVEFSASLALEKPNIDVFSEDVYVCYESNSSLTASLTSKKALDRLKAGFNKNRLLFQSRIDFVRYNYYFKFFIKAFPLILKKREVSLFFCLVVNIFIATKMNLFYKGD